MSSLTQSSGNKHEQSSNNAIDRISNLPDPILGHILSLLPTDDALATSFLSTKWKFLWKNIYKINLRDDSRQFRHVPEVNLNTKFIDFVNKVLLSPNEKSIDEFSLKIRKFSKHQYITDWIAAAVSRNAKVIEFLEDSYLRGLCMPCSLFTSTSLQFLHLNGTFINLKVPSFVSLPNLKTLILEWMVYECEKSICNLISGCPSLETLNITRFPSDYVVNFTILSPTLRNLTLKFLFDDRYINREYTLELNAPELRYLELDDHFCRNFSVENLCLLDEARITIHFDEYDEEPLVSHHRFKSVVKLLQRLSNVKNLSLMGDAFQVFSRACVISSFLRLSQLTVEVVCGHWHSLGYVVESLDNLESLTISLQYYYENYMFLSEPEDLYMHFFSLLNRKVSNEFEMVVYVLENAKALRTLTIKNIRCQSIEARIELLQKEPNFRQGFEKCQVIFSS